MVDANDDELLHKVVYDDEVTEWLSLADERFRLLTPRAHSAGCTTELMVRPKAGSTLALFPVDGTGLVQVSACLTGQCRRQLHSCVPLHT